jgi:hypothetical protein
MGNIYKRPQTTKWWMWWLDAAGVRQFATTGTDDEAVARARLTAVERQVFAEKREGYDGPVTVETYAARWLARRKKRGVASVDDDAARLRHVLPELRVEFGEDEGQPLALADIRYRHVRDAMESVMAKEVVRERSAAKTGTDGGPAREAKPLAPRTVRHVYSVLKTMLADAVLDGLITTSPCSLSAKRKEIPRVRDADPRWRDEAVFTAEEVVMLVADKRIPEVRRVTWALLFFGSVRFGEGSALQVQDWVRKDWRAPANRLGHLWVTKTFDHKELVVKSTTKTETPRKMPVLPWLERILAHWVNTGWAQTFGRHPRPDDILIPSPTGLNMRPQSSLRRFHRDLRTLELRLRRQHDARRTFISLARSNGANKELLRWCTHGRDPETINEYTTPTWESLCREVLKAPFHPPQESEPMPSRDSDVTATQDEKNPLQPRKVAGDEWRGVRDLNPWPPA